MTWWKRSRRTPPPPVERPGILIGQYITDPTSRWADLDARWDWDNASNLLIVEGPNYGAGEDLVRQIFHEFDGPKTSLDPKLYDEPVSPRWDVFYTQESCVRQLVLLRSLAHIRAEVIDGGHVVEPMLVAIPELHDFFDDPSEELMGALAELLMVSRAAHIHVLANVRPVQLSKTMRQHFTGILVLEGADSLIVHHLGLPEPIVESHAKLGDRHYNKFYPLEVRTR